MKRIVCKCGTEVNIDAPNVSIKVGRVDSRSWIHACACPKCNKLYWHGVTANGGEVGIEVMYNDKPTFFIDGKEAIKSIDGEVFIFV